VGGRRGRDQSVRAESPYLLVRRWNDGSRRHFDQAKGIADTEARERFVDAKPQGRDTASADQVREAGARPCGGVSLQAMLGDLGQQVLHEPVHVRTRVHRFDVGREEWGGRDVVEGGVKGLAHAGSLGGRAQ